MSDTTIQPLHTPCKTCVFAEYEGNTQSKCLMGLIDKYLKTDYIQILEVYDEEKEFYVVNNKKCPGFKEQKYFENRDIGEYSIEQKIEYVQNILKLKYLAVIDCLDRTPDDLATIIEELGKAKVAPEMIMVVTCNGSEYSFQDYYMSLNKSKIGCKWQIKGMADRSKDLIAVIHQVISLGANHCNFVLGIGKDYSNLHKIIDTANELVYDNMETFTIIGNESRETYLFNQFVYKAAFQREHDIITTKEDYIII